MILNDVEIRELIDNDIIKWSSAENINPWSLDISLGSEILIEKRRWLMRSRWSKLHIDPFDESYQLKPQEFILGHSTEMLDLPDDIGAELYLKSSRAREGFDHAKAVWIDPGFSGSITLEIRNNLRYSNLTLYEGLKIAQLVFFRGNKPERSYRETGRYNNCYGVQESLG